MPYRFQVQKLTPKETAIRFGAFIGLALLGFALYRLGTWLGGVPSTQPITLQAYLCILAYGAAGSSIGFSGMMLDSVMNQMGCSLAILGIVFVILLFSLPVAVVACLIILFSGGMIPAWLG
jgi:hypothetical protein